MLLFGHGNGWCGQSWMPRGGVLFLDWRQGGKSATPLRERVWQVLYNVGIQYKESLLLHLVPVVEVE